MQQQGMTGSRMPFGQQPPGGVLQGPLAYLEKTTSNIGELFIPNKLIFSVVWHHV